METIKGNQQLNMLTLNDLKRAASIRGAITQSLSSNSVCKARCNPALPIILTNSPETIGHICVLQGSDKTGNICRIILTISIHHRNDLTGGCLETRKKSRALPKIARKRNEPHPIQCGNFCTSSIRASIIHRNNLRIRKDFFDLHQDILDRAGFVEKRQHDGKGFHG
ncbi:MAG: hypothetical protein RL630_244 [Verrucomicrobiota bacterium]